MSLNRSSRNSTRRPRRPGDFKHDPDAVDESALLDDVHEQPGHEGASSRPVLCQQLVLLRVLTDCPKCSGRTPVFAMMGTPEFEIENTPTTLLRRISSLPGEVDKAVRDFSQGHWRSDQSEKARGAHWHSHCKHCAARLGETFTLGADGPFQPRLYKQRMAIKALRLTGPFVLKGVQRQSSLPLLAWLEWYRQREAGARVSRAPAKRASPR